MLSVRRTSVSVHSSGAHIKLRNDLWGFQIGTRCRYPTLTCSTALQPPYSNIGCTYAALQTSTDQLATLFNAQKSKRLMLCLILFLFLLLILVKLISKKSCRSISSVMAVTRLAQIFWFVSSWLSRGGAPHSSDPLVGPWWDQTGLPHHQRLPGPQHAPASLHRSPLPSREGIPLPKGNHSTDTQVSSHLSVTRAELEMMSSIYNLPAPSNSLITSQYIQLEYLPPLYQTSSMNNTTEG